MTVSTLRTIEGQQFEFMPGTWYFTEPSVVIPVSTLEGLDEKTFGSILRQLIYEAYYAEALDTADGMIQYSTMKPELRGLIPADILARNAESIERMKKFSGLDDRIDEAINVVKISLEAARIAAERKPAKEIRVYTKAQRVRAELQTRYHKTFVALGRRDGFHCAICFSSESDLQIDHIMPVSKGGINEFDNLRLLCRSCNAEKSDMVENAEEANRG